MWPSTSDKTEREKNKIKTLYEPDVQSSEEFEARVTEALDDAASVSNILLQELKAADLGRSEVENR